MTKENGCTTMGFGFSYQIRLGRHHKDSPRPRVPISPRLS
jgi:hypothetical protein